MKKLLFIITFLYILPCKANTCIELYKQSKYTEVKVPLKEEGDIIYLFCKKSTSKNKKYDKRFRIK